ncbi:hypothetical protein BZZ01_18860 [Nostocales cyanobacterium HT-58-2]|nr:hypothetical protein BZZ01_18860 [Nostocales cyanobacterium HT-58-2]
MWGLTLVFLRAINYLKKQKLDRILAIVVFAISIVILLANYVFLGSYNFEGSLTVREMSFTYTGQTEKLFLNTIRSIQNLDFQGKQPQALVLTGKFSSKSDPVLNQKLTQLKQLTIELPHATSRLILTPANRNKSELSILELHLLPDSSVNQLAYEPKKTQLSLCLQAASLPPDTCLFPEGLRDKFANPVGSLRVQLGQRALVVSLAGVNLPELNIRSDAEASEELLLEVEPKNDEFLLPLLTPTSLFIQLPVAKVAQSDANDVAEWFRRNLDVTHVNFSRLDTTGKVKDELQISTILEGKVRMGAQVMELQPEQFLIIPPKEVGIRRLRSIRIHPNSPQGLQTLISGETRGIAVGLYPAFPVQKIEPSWLSKHISQDAVNALLTFLGALNGILLPRLLPESPQKPDLSGNTKA